MGELGLLGACIPSEHGGAGADFLSYVLALEEISRGDAGLGVTFAVQDGRPAADPRQRHPRADRPPDPARCAGPRACAFALTESGSGQRRSAMLTRADDGGCLTGTKQWITDGSTRTRSTVFARETATRSARISCAAARPASPSTREEEKLGQHSSSTAASPSTTPRPSASGRRRRHADRAVDARRRADRHRRPGRRDRAGRARRRDALRQGAQAFGRPIAGFQAISHKLADMQTEIEAARAAGAARGRAKDAGAHIGRGRSSQAVRQPRRCATWTGEAIQVLGGYGYTKDFPAERYHRDAR